MDEYTYLLNLSTIVTQLYPSDFDSLSMKSIYRSSHICSRYCRLYNSLRIRIKSFSLTFSAVVETFLFIFRLKISWTILLHILRVFGITQVGRTRHSFRMSGMREDVDAVKSHLIHANKGITLV